MALQLFSYYRKNVSDGISSRLKFE